MSLFSDLRNILFIVLKLSEAIHAATLLWTPALMPHKVLPLSTLRSIRPSFCGRVHPLITFSAGPGQESVWSDSSCQFQGRNQKSISFQGLSDGTGDKNSNQNTSNWGRWRQSWQPFLRGHFFLYLLPVKVGRKEIKQDRGVSKTP